MDIATVIVVIVSIIIGVPIGCEVSRQGRIALIFWALGLPATMHYAVIVVSRLPDLHIHFGDVYLTAAYAALSVLLAYLLAIAVTRKAGGTATKP
jgi:hypothetical protein